MVHHVEIVESRSRLSQNSWHRSANLIITVMNELNGLDSRKHTLFRINLAVITQSNRPVTILNRWNAQKYFWKVSLMTQCDVIKKSPGAQTTSKTTRSSYYISSKGFFRERHCPQKGAGYLDKYCIWCNNNKALPKSP